MAAILHCIVTEVENSRWKDHIRDWNTNMKLDMYEKLKNTIKEKDIYIRELKMSVFDLDDSDNVICEECGLFYFWECGRRSVEGEEYCNGCYDKLKTNENWNEPEWEHIEGDFM